MFPLRSYTQARRDDKGVALVGVIGLMAVGVIITAVVSTATISALSYSSLTRSGVQSQAAAEAGIADARAGLIDGTCVTNGGVYNATAEGGPNYFATVWLPSGTDWVRGCPTGTSTTVRILSSGYSNPAGDDAAHLEAVLSDVESSGGVIPSGPALYAYNSDGFTGGGTIVSLNGEIAEIMIREGDISCTGGADGTANLVINNGDLNVGGGCQIRGNVWVEGDARLSGGGEIGGNLVADAVDMTTWVGGNLWADGPLSVRNGRGIGGNATADSLTISSSTISGNAWIYGNTHFGWSGRVAGNLTTKSRTNQGNGAGTVGSQTIVPGGPGPSPFLQPPTPFVPDWVDYDFDAADWPGFTVVSPTGTCSYTTWVNALATIGERPGVIDARGCRNAEFTMGGSDTLTMRDDLVVVAEDFQLSGGSRFAASTSVNLWLIVPDYIVNSEPDCPRGAGFAINGGMSLDAPILTMIYTPCRLNLSSSTHIRGQVYGGEVRITGGATVSYAAVGIPGADLSTGELVDSTAGTERDRAILWIRGIGEGN